MQKMNNIMADTIIGTVAEWERIYQKGVNKYISHTYIAEGNETPVTLAANTPSKYTLPVTLKESNGFGVADPGLPTQALQFTAENETDILFELSASTSMTTTTNNCNVWMYAYVNDSPAASCLIQRKVGTGADVGAVGLDSTFRVSTGDLIEVYVKSDLATDLTFIYTSILIKQM